MNKPTVSVLMATYNHELFVKQAIDSVISQEGVDFEFLIADDGSSDLTRDVVASITDPRIQFFPNTINRGACVVTNELISRSSGEFIAIINSDDCWTVRDKLTHQLEILRSNPQISACFGRTNFIDRNGLSIDKSEIRNGYIFDQENRTQGEWLRYFFERGNCICHPTILIRKSCYDEIGLYNNCYRQLPDLDMWVRLVKRYPIFISDRVLVNFRILPGENASSGSKNNIIRTLNEQFLIAENFFDDCDRNRLIEGFGDLLVFPDIPSDIHLAIEKCLLYFIENPVFGSRYNYLGLLKINKLLNNESFQTILFNGYGIDDHWFHQKTSIINFSINWPDITDFLTSKFEHFINQATSKSSINGIRSVFKKRNK